MMANLEVSLVDDPTAWALLLDPDGFVTEGTGANFFIVSNGILYTPEGRNILRGITRMYIIDLAKKLNISVNEKNIELYDVIHADEAFYTSTAMSVMPCTKVNGLTVGNGKPGEITLKLINEWSEEVGVNIIGQSKEYANEVKDLLDGTNIYRFKK